MANLAISGSPSTTTNTVTVNFTTDVSNISKVELSNNGGSTYISATSFTSSSAVFNVATWSNGTYSNCKLRLTYGDSSSGGTIPGGTATNLLDGKTLINAYFNNNTGEVVTSGASAATGSLEDYIPVTAGATYTFNCNMNGATLDNFRYGWYNSSKTYMSYNTITGTTPFDITIPSGASYIRFHIVTDASHTYSSVTNLSLALKGSSSSGSSGGTDSGGTTTNPNILTGLTYGKGWDNVSSSVVDNPACWTTVDKISVTVNKRYKISCDAAWLWIRTFDSSGSLVAILSEGADTNPSEYTFTANAPYIRCGCYDPYKTLTYFKLEEV